MKRRGLILYSTHRTPRVLAEILPGLAAFLRLATKDVWIDRFPSDKG